MIALTDRLRTGIAGLDQGAAQRVLQILLLLMVGAAIYGTHAWSRFRGLEEPAGMEYAQLARNVAEGRGFTTQVIRPVDLWHLERTAGQRSMADRAHPDLRHGPVWPAMLAVGFRATRQSYTAPAGARVFEPERRVIIPLGIALSLAAALAILLLGATLFDFRTGVVAAVMIFLNGALLRQSLSGSSIPVATFLTAAAVCAAVFAARQWNRGARLPAWLGCAILAALFCAAAFLTRYSAVVLLPMLLLWFHFGFRARSRVLLPVCLVVFALAATPWMLRNRTATGSFLGMAPYAALQESLLFPDTTLDRAPAPAMHNVHISNALRAKVRSNIRHALDEGVGLWDAGILAAFFIAALFQRFDSEEAERLKWLVLLGVILMAALVALQGASARALLTIFFPLVILVGTASFFALVDRLCAYHVEMTTSFSVGLIGFAALPFLLGLSEPRAPIPYPPYYPPLNAYAAHTVGTDEWLCTDIPEATAWYGNRTSLLLPNRVDDFIALTTAGGIRIDALYLAHGIDRTHAGPPARSAPPLHSSWRSILERRIPEHFPLQHGIDLPPGSRDQLLLLREVDPVVSEPATPSADSEKVVSLETP